MKASDMPEFGAYPNVIHAIAYVELLLDGEEENNSWVILRNHALAGKMTVAQIIEFIKDGCRDEISDGSRGKWVEVIAESDHPEFTTYLKGKLGAM